MTCGRLLMAVLMGLVMSPDVWAAPGGSLSGADTLRWYERVQQLDEVTVHSSRRRYSRRDNPAVDLMRRVIAARRATDLSRHDHYYYNKYQKITMSVNDVGTDDLSKGVFGKIPETFRQVELCPYNNRMILPLTVTETLTAHAYRRRPRASRTILRASRSEGINRVFTSGELITASLKDFFTDIDIYKDHIPLLQHRFVSPIGSGAIGFYRFFIIDTTAVAADRCIRVRFVPGNLRDFGFSGELYILDDSSYQVRRCELTIPRRSDVNFVERLRVFQEFGTTPGGERVLTTDDMVAEIRMFDFLSKCIVVRNTRLDGYHFGPLPDALFSGPGGERTEKGAHSRDENYWMLHRRVELTPGERNMAAFVSGLKRAAGGNVTALLARMAVEGYVETGGRDRPSKVDLGPVSSFVSSNYVDGLRLRVGGQTTANLSPHLFLSGYYARGWDSRQDYYNAELTYSFNRKAYLPREKPMRSISFASTYDLVTPSVRFMQNDKDNVFTALRWAADDMMMTCNRQQLKAVREEEWGLRTTLSLTAEENGARGNLRFCPVGSAAAVPEPRGETVEVRPEALSCIRTTELRAELRYAPGERFVCTKRGRRLINRDATVLTLSHAAGIDGLLGGRYAYHYTEAALYSRLWMGSWGKIDVRLRAGAQWSRVPFPLLCQPAANLSCIKQDGMFSLMRSMELLSDRSAMADLSWDLNGKILNRLPLVRSLKWREYVGVKVLWGCLTDKNNPQLARNSASTLLMRFPEGSHVLRGDRPYIEVTAGLHNVFRFFHVEYVRRLTYLSLPTATRHGVRFRFALQF